MTETTSLFGPFAIQTPFTAIIEVGCLLSGNRNNWTEIKFVVASLKEPAEWAGDYLRPALLAAMFNVSDHLERLFAARLADEGASDKQIVAHLRSGFVQAMVARIRFVAGAKPTEEEVKAATWRSLPFPASKFVGLIEYREPTRFEQAVWEEIESSFNRGLASLPSA